MWLPVMRGVIDRRILANYHVDPEYLARILPAPFRPKLVQGWGLAGICLIRLKRVRPRFFPLAMGFSSENAAHRIAVEWDDHGVPRQGVYVPRRDTSSRLNTLVGGRVFPGVHQHARFDVRETDRHLSVAMRSDDGKTRVAVEGTVSDRWPSESVFESLAEASTFFECGSLGYSPAACPGTFEGLELRTFQWHLESLDVSKIQSSFFEDPEFFPPESVHFDSALLMRNIEHEWHGRPSLRSAGEGVSVR
ncbi:MAG: hypothetical protein JWN70_3928 [Planctomycetaceae bacterium]|nr:hypothetical protein [Planctomycetaceae bacterium]